MARSDRKHRSSTPGSGSGVPPTAQAFLDAHRANHPEHRCQHSVQVGSHHIYLGGTQYLTHDDLTGFDAIVPLTGGNLTIVPFGATVLWAPMVDFGGVPDGWHYFIDSKVAPLVKSGKRLAAFCAGSHGRTGTFAASLIALLEGHLTTPDPIAAIRERHCRKAVETLAQAEAVYAMRYENLPHRYQEEFGSSRSRSVPASDHGLRFP